MKILAVDDEDAIRALLEYNLSKEGWKVLCAKDATTALRIARSDEPALIVLDLMLPDMSGLDVCRVLKNDSATARIPIIMLTAKSEDADIVTGLELGADDYVAKPFSPRVLVARIKSVLRRYEKTGEPVQREFFVRGVRLDAARHEASVSGVPVDLSATEFATLEYLMQNPGRVFSRVQIINGVKGESYPVTERSIDVQILNIRRKLAAAGASDVIETVRGIGYRMAEDADEKREHKDGAT